MKASEIATIVEGTLEGGADPELTGVAPLDRAGPEELTFLAKSRYLPYLERARAGAILITSELAERGRTPMPRIVVRDVHQALATVLGRLYPAVPVAPSVHPTARLGEGVELGQGVSLGAYAVIEERVRIGDRANVGAHCFVGKACRLGDDVVLHSHVTLYPSVEVGNRSILHSSGVRAGVDGFGYVFADGAHRKVPQVGGCTIGEDVEIGANTTIDRGSVGSTEIGNGVKIDIQQYCTQRACG